MTGAEWLKAVDPKPILEFLKLNNKKKGIRYKKSERKLRLFATACCRRVWSRIDDHEVGRSHSFLVELGWGNEGKDIRADCGRKGIEIAERFADGLASQEELDHASECARQLALAGDKYAATKPTVIGQDETDYGLLATGEAACAIERLCSFSYHDLQIEYTADHCARSAAFLACNAHDPLPDPEMDRDERSHQTLLLREILGNPFGLIAFNPFWRTPTVFVLATGIYDEKAFDRLPILADALQDTGCDNDDLLNHLRKLGDHCRGCWALDLVLDKE